MDRDKKLVAADAPGHSRQEAADFKTLEFFIATGFGSRGGPNKVSNKFRRCPNSYSFDKR